MICTARSCGVAANNARRILCAAVKKEIVLTDSFLMIAEQVLVLFVLIAVGFACGKKAC